MDYIIVDTSSIIFALSNKRDVFSAAKEQFPESRIMISKGVIRELDALGKGGGKDSRHARLAIALLSKHADITVQDDASYVDGWILSEAPRLKALVCTNDTGLRKLLKQKGVNTVTVSKGGILR